MATEFSNIDFGFRYGTQRAINTADVLEGTFNIATDTGELYIDIGGSRVTMNKDIHLYNTEAEIRAIPEPGLDRLYFAKDTYRLFVYDHVNLRWVNVGGSPDEINARIDNLINVVDSIHSFEIVIIPEGEELPEEGQSNIIYFVPEGISEDHSAKYDEYVWIANEGYYEKIGICEADLGGYCKREEINAIIGENYVTDPQDINFKGTVSTRLYNSEQNIEEIKSEIGSLDSTVTGYIPVANRLTELEAKMGATMDPSSTTGFTSVDARLDTLESTASGSGDDITEIKAKFGTYSDSMDTGFVTVESRFTEIESKLGSMGSSTDTGFVTVDGRLDSLEGRSTSSEANITELKDKFGTYKASTSAGFISVEARFTELEAKMGATMDPSTTQGFITVDRRLGNLESGATTSGNNITELQNKFGDYPVSTTAGFVNVNSRFNEIEAKLGSTMNPSSTTGFKSVDSRLTTLETTGALAADVIEIANKIGDYPDSTDPDFISIWDKLIELENRIIAIEEHGLSVAEPYYPEPDELEPEEPDEPDPEESETPEESTPGEGE